MQTKTRHHPVSISWRAHHAATEEKARTGVPIGYTVRQALELWNARNLNQTTKPPQHRTRYIVPIEQNLIADILRFADANHETVTSIVSHAVLDYIELQKQ